MKLWMPSGENIYTAEVVFQIETTKEDLRRMEFELNKAIEQKKIIISAIELLKKNIKFLTNFAEIVSLREYKKSIYQLSGLLQDEIEISRLIFSYQNDIDYLTEKIEKLEIKKRQVKFKVLEFKLR